MGDFLNGIINFLVNILWGWESSPWFLSVGILGVLLISVGLYFTIRLRVIQLVKFPDILRSVKHSFKPAHEDGISAFRAFSTSIAARVGAGNVTGVAIAITLGGPGAVFWMWVIAFVGMATSMVESTLAQVFKQREHKDGEHVFRGGPAYYMEKGLNARWAGILFSIILLIAFPFAMVALQSNVMAGAVEGGFNIDPIYTGIAAAVATGLIIFGGIRRISGFTEVFVPIMAIAYVGMAIFVMALNFDAIPGAFADIFRSAFGLQEAAGGVAGYAISQAIIQGFRRGLFSNEAGMGSAPNVAAAADVKHPASQGFIQSIGVFVDTMLICTATAMIILLSGVWTPGLTRLDDGTLLTQDSLSNVVPWGAQFVAIALVAFTFTTIVAMYYYGETALWFLIPTEKLQILLRLLVIGTVLFGSLAAATSVWALADATLGLLAVVNLIAIALLGGVAVKVIKDYTRQLKDGVEQPEFSADDFPELAIEPQAWQSISTAEPEADRREGVNPG